MSDRSHMHQTAGESHTCPFKLELTWMFGEKPLRGVWLEERFYRESDGGNYIIIIIF